MTWGCIPQVQSCFGCVVASATVVILFFDCQMEDVIFVANTAAKVKTTAHAAVTNVFMRFHAMKFRAEKEAAVHTESVKTRHHSLSSLEGIRW
jgi:hypothetical protein